MCNMINTSIGTFVTINKYKNHSVAVVYPVSRENQNYQGIKQNIINTIILYFYNLTTIESITLFTMYKILKLIFFIYLLTASLKLYCTASL